MRHFLFTTLIIIVFSNSAWSQNTKIYIPANQTIELDYPNFDMFTATVINSSFKDIDVAVLSKNNNEQIRGFGLGVKGKADVMVEAENKLVLKNGSNKDISVKLKIKEATRKESFSDDSIISFTLKNTTAKSIPLLIPSVMNPNLSPYSNSGVDLKIGQQIFFKEKGKKYLLLTVDETIAQDSTLDVAKILKERKQELGL